jgi:hypothetical protein
MGLQSLGKRTSARNILGFDNAKTDWPGKYVEEQGKLKERFVTRTFSRFKIFALQGRLGITKINWANGY